MATSILTPYPGEVALPSTWRDHEEHLAREAQERAASPAEQKEAQPVRIPLRKNAGVTGTGNM